jgi:hypothetical protein
VEWRHKVHPETHPLVDEEKRTRTSARRRDITYLLYEGMQRGVQEKVCIETRR